MKKLFNINAENSFYSEFNLEDLLDREPLEVNLFEVEAEIKQSVVLISGGGGSIGSELCRQLIQMKPSQLVIVDHSEFNLYEIDRQLSTLISDTQIEPILADIKDLNSMREVFRTHRPDFVYHAAAYKHVHLVEQNPYISILNNILGTRNLLSCSLEFDVESFVMISTDKAVNPSSIMGATKRVCELMVSEAALEKDRKFCSVRFGNVLGSSGSLIPLLKKQINSGGPVTVTDPEMSRYFMLISEAVQLVLKAGHISQPGDINILKMGNPIKILDLARRVISLMGKTETEIPIVFIGKRPGEKLFEELYLSGDEFPTEHKDIVVLSNRDAVYNADSFSGKSLEYLVSKMIHYAISYDSQALDLLKELAFVHKRHKPLQATM